MLKLPKDSKSQRRKGLQDVSDSDGFSGGGHPGANLPAQPQPEQEPPPVGVLLQVHHVGSTTNQPDGQSQR